MDLGACDQRGSACSSARWRQVGAVDGHGLLTRRWHLCARARVAGPDTQRMRSCVFVDAGDREIEKHEARPLDAQPPSLKEKKAWIAPLDQRDVNDGVKEKGVESEEQQMECRACVRSAVLIKLRLVPPISEMDLPRWGLNVGYRSSLILGKKE